MDTQDKLATLMDELYSINLNILENLKNKTSKFSNKFSKNSEEFSCLLNERESLSKKIKDFCTSSKNIPDIKNLKSDLQAKSKKLMNLDKELLIYLDLEMQKLRGEREKLLISSRQNKSFQ